MEAHLQLLRNAPLVRTSTRDTVQAAVRAVTEHISGGDAKVPLEQVIAGVCHACGHPDAVVRLAAEENLARCVKVGLSRNIGEGVCSALRGALGDSGPPAYRSICGQLVVAFGQVARSRCRDVATVISASITDILQRNDPVAVDEMCAASEVLLSAIGSCLSVAESLALFNQYFQIAIRSESAVTVRNAASAAAAAVQYGSNAAGAARYVLDALLEEASGLRLRAPRSTRPGRHPRTVRSDTDTARVRPEPPYARRRPLDKVGAAAAAAAVAAAAPPVPAAQGSDPGPVPSGPPSSPAPLPERSTPRLLSLLTLAHRLLRTGVVRDPAPLCALLLTARGCTAPMVAVAALELCVELAPWPSCAAAVLLYLRALLRPTASVSVLGLCLNAAASVARHRRLEVLRCLSRYSQRGKPAVAADRDKDALPSVPDIVQPFSTHADPLIRSGAATVVGALAAIDPPAAESLLLLLLADPLGPVRRAAAAALAGLPGTPSGAVLGMLTTVRTDAYWLAAAEALTAATRLARNAATCERIIPALDSALDSSDARVRLAAAEGLAQLCLRQHSVIPAVAGRLMLRLVDCGAVLRGALTALGLCTSALHFSAPHASAALLTGPAWPHPAHRLPPETVEPFAELAVLVLQRTRTAMVDIVTHTRALEVLALLVCLRTPASLPVAVLTHAARVLHLVLDAMGGMVASRHTAVTLFPFVDSASLQSLHRVVKSVLAVAASDGDRAAVTDLITAACACIAASARCAAVPGASDIAEGVSFLLQDVLLEAGPPALLAARELFVATSSGDATTVVAPAQLARMFEPMVPHALRLCMSATGPVLTAAAEFLASASVFVSEDSYLQLLPHVLSPWTDVYSGARRATANPESACPVPSDPNTCCAALARLGVALRGPNVARVADWASTLVSDAAVSGARLGAAPAIVFEPVLDAALQLGGDAEALRVTGAVSLVTAVAASCASRLDSARTLAVMLRRCRVSDHSLWQQLSSYAWSGIRACVVAATMQRVPLRALDDARLLAEAVCWTHVDGLAVRRMLRRGGAAAFLSIALEALVSFSVSGDLGDYAEGPAVRDAPPAPPGLTWQAVAAACVRVMASVDHRHAARAVPGAVPSGAAAAAAAAAAGTGAHAAASLLMPPPVGTHSSGSSHAAPPPVDLYSVLAAAVRTSTALAAALTAETSALTTCGAAASECAECRAAWFTLAAALRTDPGRACLAYMRGAAPLSDPAMRLAARAVAACIGRGVTVDEVAGDARIMAAFAMYHKEPPVQGALQLPAIARAICQHVSAQVAASRDRFLLHALVDCVSQVPPLVPERQSALHALASSPHAPPSVRHRARVTLDASRSPADLPRPAARTPSSLLTELGVLSEDHYELIASVLARPHAFDDGMWFVLRRLLCGSQPADMRTVLAPSQPVHPTQWVACTVAPLPPHVEDFVRARLLQTLRESPDASSEPFLLWAATALLSNAMQPVPASNEDLVQLLRFGTVVLETAPPLDPEWMRRSVLVANAVTLVAGCLDCMLDSPGPMPPSVRDTASRALRLVVRLAARAVGLPKLDDPVLLVARMVSDRVSLTCAGIAAPLVAAFLRCLRCGIELLDLLMAPVPAVPTAAGRELPSATGSGAGAAPAPVDALPAGAVASKDSPTQLLATPVKQAFDLPPTAGEAAPAPLPTWDWTLPSREPRTLALLAALMSGVAIAGSATAAAAAAAAAVAGAAAVGDGAALRAGSVRSALLAELETVAADAGARGAAGRQAIAGLLALHLPPSLDLRRRLQFVRLLAERSVPHAGHVASVLAQLTAQPDPVAWSGSVGCGTVSRPPGGCAFCASGGLDAQCPICTALRSGHSSGGGTGGEAEGAGSTLLPVLLACCTGTAVSVRPAALRALSLLCACRPPTGSARTSVLAAVRRVLQSLEPEHLTCDALFALPAIGAAAAVPEALDAESVTVIVGAAGHLLSTNPELVPANELLTASLRALAWAAPAQLPALVPQLPALFERCMFLAQAGGTPRETRVAALECATALLLHFPRVAAERRFSTALVPFVLALLHQAVPHASSTPLALLHGANRVLRQLVGSPALPDALRYSAAVDSGVTAVELDPAWSLRVLRMCHAMQLLSRLDAAEAASSLASLTHLPAAGRVGDFVSAALPWLLEDLRLTEHALSIVVGDLVKVASTGVTGTRLDRSASIVILAGPWLAREAGPQLAQWIMLSAEQLVERASPAMAAWTLCVLWSAFTHVPLRALYAPVWRQAGLLGVDGLALRAGQTPPLSLLRAVCYAFFRRHDITREAALQLGSVLRRVPGPEFEAMRQGLPTEINLIRVQTAPRQFA